MGVPPKGNWQLRLQTIPRALISLLSLIAGAALHAVWAPSSGYPANVLPKQSAAAVQTAAADAIAGLLVSDEPPAVAENPQDFLAGTTPKPDARPESSALQDANSEVVSLPTLEDIASKFRTGIGGRIHAETKELHFGGDKGCHLHCYTPYYNEKFAAVRTRKGIKLLEIGVMAGDSLALWSLYFPNSPSIYGVDIATDTFEKNLPKLKALGAFPTGDPTVMKADPTRQAGANKVIEAGPYDIVIDDGSHATDHILGAFHQLFLRAVKPGGIYCIEDLEHFHLPANQQNKRKDFFWNLIESNQWRGSNMLKRDHQIGFINKKVVDVAHGVPTRATDLETWVDTIEFHRQICCIRKRRLCKDVVGKDWSCVEDEVWDKLRDD